MRKKPLIWVWAHNWTELQSVHCKHVTQSAKNSLWYCQMLKTKSRTQACCSVPDEFTVHSCSKRRYMPISILTKIIHNYNIGRVPCVRHTNTKWCRCAVDNFYLAIHTHHSWTSCVNFLFGRWCGMHISCGTQRFINSHLDLKQTYILWFVNCFKSLAAGACKLTTSSRLHNHCLCAQGCMYAVIQCCRACTHAQS